MSQLPAVAGLTLARARTSAEIEAASQLRRQIYQKQLGLDPDRWQLESARDRAGLTFLLRDQGSLIGTGRAIPTSSPLCELHELGQLPDSFRGDDVCEVGRVAVRARTKSLPYATIMLCLGARWLVDHTTMRRYISYARVQLLWLWKRVNAEDLGPRFLIPGRGDVEYALIHGRLADAAAALADIDAALTILTGRADRVLEPGRS